MSNTDLSQYLHHLAETEMPEHAKAEFLRAVHGIMQSFVDRAFGEDAVQLARKGADKPRTSCARAKNEQERSHDE